MDQLTKYSMLHYKDTLKVYRCNDRLENPLAVVTRELICLLNSNNVYRRNLAETYTIC